MTNKEIEKKIEELENKKFFLAMKDRWSDRDFQRDRELSRQIAELKEMLKES